MITNHHSGRAALTHTLQGCSKMAGRKPYEPTDKDRMQVEAACGYGLTHERIAALIGIDPKTLRKHFRTELDVGAAKADAAVARSLFENATKFNNVTAQIWWTKSRMGWADRLAIEHTGKDGEALNFTINLVPSNGKAG